MNRLVLSLLVENNPGVLSRVAGLFSRRGYGIESLSVGKTNEPNVSRMTVVAVGDELILNQIEKQLGKLVEVIEIFPLKPEESVYRELVLVKLRLMKNNVRHLFPLPISLEHGLLMLHQHH